MIRRPTIVYIVVLIAMVGAYFYLKNRNQAEPDVAATVEPTQEVSYLFAEDSGIPSSIRIEAATGEVIELARDADNAWVLTEPFEAKADQAASEAAASQITTMRVLDRIPEMDLEVVGLKIPAYTITIGFTGKQKRTILIGVTTPSENGYYVQDGSNKEIMIVSKSAVDTLLGLLTAPPYLETPTPSPLPATETPVPSPTPAVSTPSIATPTP
jgi:hypothetical protein